LTILFDELKLSTQCCGFKRQGSPFKADTAPATVIGDKSPGWPLPVRWEGRGGGGPESQDTCFKPGGLVYLRVEDRKLPVVKFSLSGGKGA